MAQQKKRSSPSGDPLFAAEMEAVAAQRKARTADFAAEWHAAVDDRPPIHVGPVSTLHQHGEDCLGDPQYVSPAGHQGYIWARKCSRTFGAGSIYIPCEAPEGRVPNSG